MHGVGVMLFYQDGVVDSRQFHLCSACVPRITNPTGTETRQIFSRDVCNGKKI